ncbi:MAG: hypothetical protein UT33_C0007G0021 [Candidatus Peregrinibacteria bacterium GW2011_GWC2_39_14]|nr:MAG: hypothetical protein US92_C0002G0022 [Candidatus Peregrinibacteria bacterium GW2011_GWA2_38_36]KKR06833.1 MAG: hypothetical protein UT33_C0007G0021 [Candidatus Peregrinibacteria bacterium GW2011_GWC2_39_14]
MESSQRQRVWSIGDAREGAKHVIEGAEDLLHPNAWTELNQRQTIANVTKWIRDRLERLEICQDDQLQIILNAWNEAPYEIGLQSLTVKLLRRYQQDMIADGLPTEGELLSDEWDAPTIGIITHGLIESGVMSEVSFPIDEGKGERLYKMSGNLCMKGSSDERPTNEHRLEKNVPILVTGPDALQTFTELKKVDPAKAVRGEMEKHHGVYACRKVSTIR